MKKIFVVLLSIVMAFCFVGCGDSEGTVTPSPRDEISFTVPDDSTTVIAPYTAASKEKLKEFFSGISQEELSDAQTDLVISVLTKAKITEEKAVKLIDFFTKVQGDALNVTPDKGFDFIKNTYTELLKILTADDIAKLVYEYAGITGIENPLAVVSKSDFIILFRLLDKGINLTLINFDKTVITTLTKTNMTSEDIVTVANSVGTTANNVVTAFTQAEFDKVFEIAADLLCKLSGITDSSQVALIKQECKTMSASMSATLKFITNMLLKVDVSIVNDLMEEATQEPLIVKKVATIADLMMKSYNALSAAEKLSVSAVMVTPIMSGIMIIQMANPLADITQYTKLTTDFFKVIENIAKLRTSPTNVEGLADCEILIDFVEDVGYAISEMAGPSGGTDVPSNQIVPLYQAA